VDAMNNIYDADLDEKSDPLRAEYTKNLGTLGLFVSFFFLAVAVSLGVATQIPLLTVFIVVSSLAGVLYLVPPFRLRQTVLKPLVNFSVGSVPVLIVASFFSVFSVQVWPLVFLIGITTAVNSLWEDLADYASNLNNDAKTFLVVLGLRRGFFTTIVLGFCLVPLMVLIGVMFNLSLLYYAIFSLLVAFMSLRLIQNRTMLLGKEGDSTEQTLKLGKILAKDFVVLAIVQTTNIMLSGFLKYHAGFLF
jgi:4-hydroxybenzoate polyprenyltransferase